MQTWKYQNNIYLLFVSNWNGFYYKHPKRLTTETTLIIIANNFWKCISMNVQNLSLKSISRNWSSLTSKRVIEKKLFFLQIKLNTMYSIFKNIEKASNLGKMFVWKIKRSWNGFEWLNRFSFFSNSTIIYWLNRFKETKVYFKYTLHYCILFRIILTYFKIDFKIILSFSQSLSNSNVLYFCKYLIAVTLRSVLNFVFQFVSNNPWKFELFYLDNLQVILRQYCFFN